jgi:DNA-binding Xre family transcriptional regulator
MKRKVSYTLRLRELMVARGMFQTTDFVRPLTDRGLPLSPSQVHRLVTGTPERLSLAVLAALCDILDVTPTDLIPTTAANVAPRRRGADAGDDLERVVDLPTARSRPTRARITPEP